MNVFKGLLRSRKVWLAIIGVLQTVIFTALPDFDPAVWQAINVLLLAVIAGIAIEDAAEKMGQKPIQILPMPEGNPTMVNRTPPPSARAWTPPPPE